ncbi:MAG TPA: cysteine desulfurase NifS [Halanaerobiales bacterium]|nr:cysteine desulfurase NifS [Halanaerobiales bacterium]
MNDIYLDHAATTPMDPAVIKTVNKYMKNYYGNPSSIYQTGQKSLNEISQARQSIADYINAGDLREIIFTSGGTESDNLAIKGTALARQDKGKHIITTKIEHHAVLHTCEYLEKKHGFDVTYLDVDEKGFVNIDALKDAVNDNTILVSIMTANNEIGSIQPIEEIGEFLKDKDIYFHTDAVQALGQLDVDVQTMNIDLLSASAHKLYGPKGVGILFIKKGTKLIPQMNGGAQERNRRAGTENVPGIMGFKKAVEILKETRNEKVEKNIFLRDKIIKGIENNIDNVILNGPRGDKRLSNNVNFCFKNVEGESLLLNLDMIGIAASSGSACASGSVDPSHVLLAIGRDKSTARGSLRLSLGKDNTESEVEFLIEKLPGIISRIREMSPLNDN